jgi:hypothetical protein
MGRVANLPVLIQKVYNEFMELVGDDLKVVAPFRQLSPVLHSATLIKNR